MTSLASSTATRSRCSSPARPALTAVLLLAPLVGGCQAFAPLAYYFSPPHVQKAEYKFPPNSRLALFVDPVRPEFDHPLFIQGLHQRVRQTFFERKSTVEIIPLERLASLHRSGIDVRSWSIQKIGRELDATHVLYLRVEQLTLRAFPEVPVLEPSVTLYQKLIAVDHPENDARVWPAEREGRQVLCSRQPIETTEEGAEDAEVRKLGIDTAYFVTMPYFDTDLEAPRPIER